MSGTLGNHKGRLWRAHARIEILLISIDFTRLFGSTSYATLAFQWPRPRSLPGTYNPRREWALLHLSFVVIGVITTLLGPILPSFSHRWALTDAQAGVFFHLSILFQHPRCDSHQRSVTPAFGFSKVSAAGFVAFSVGFAFLGLGPWFISALMMGISGFGYGLANPAINLRATQLPSKNTAAAVTFLNFSWSVGAVLCPFLVGALIPSIHLRGFAILITACSIVLIILHLSLRTAPSPCTRAHAPHPLADWLAHMRLPQAIPLLLLFFLYVGVEVALGGWVASFEKRMPGMAAITLVIAPSVYYGALLLGRGIAPFAFRHFSQIAISGGGLFLATRGRRDYCRLRTPRTFCIWARPSLASGSLRNIQYSLLGLRPSSSKIPTGLALFSLALPASEAARSPGSWESSPPAPVLFARACLSL